MISIYLDLIQGKLKYISGGLISVEYGNNSDIYEDYSELTAHAKHVLKKAGVEI
jgi:hypothetical protein